ncbi:hypothetical protein [Cylindrospermopsis raciborskii]|uniref:hypothetical protein n=1 Tax=Cylindrospermopsis raciborskii TaxID=77022 RepID=UPI001114D9A4|nr:hypothetical protein [Cylindrospermopsis raciborskii]NLQ03856.1 hypothetical protein [Cylindrospermopsis raciborskii MVCC19]
MLLQEQTIAIDSQEYYINELGKLLGIMMLPFEPIVRSVVKPLVLSRLCHYMTSQSKSSVVRFIDFDQSGL